MSKIKAHKATIDEIVVLPRYFKMRGMPFNAISCTKDGLIMLDTKKYHTPKVDVIWVNEHVDLEL